MTKIRLRLSNSDNAPISMNVPRNMTIIELRQHISEHSQKKINSFQLISPSSRLTLSDNENYSTISDLNLENSLLIQKDISFLNN